MPRLRMIGLYLARPMRLMTPSLRPPSWYSCTSISTSRPLHSWNAPSPNLVPEGASFALCEPDSPPTLLRNVIWNRKLRSSCGSGMFLPDCQRPITRTRQRQHDEFQRLRRRHADVGDQASSVGNVRRIIGFIAAYKKCLLLTGAAKGADPEKMPQIN